MTCKYQPGGPGKRKTLPIFSASIITFALTMTSVAQLSAGNSLIPGQDPADQATCLQLAGVNAPADAHAHHHHMMNQTGAGQEADDPHAHHRHMMNQKGYKRSTHNYDIPPLTLVDMDNNKVSLDEVLATDEPVMLNFIFTTCTTICPVLSATFTQVQRELGDEAEQVKMISITIDPEYDTPKRLRDYAERFNAGPQWEFYTGSNADIIAVQRAFDAYRGSKTNHEPLTFLRTAEDPEWVRVNGLASAADVVKEYRQLLAQ